MANGDVFAFPERQLADRELPKFNITHLRVSGTPCLGVRRQDFNAFCRGLGLKESQVTTQPTDYAGVLLVQVKGGSKVRHGKRKSSPPKQGTKASRDQYLALCGNKRIAEHVAELERSVQQLDSDVAVYQKQLVDALRGLEAHQDELGRLKAGGSQAGLLRQEFDKLMTNPDIDTFEIRDTTLVVHTKPIRIRYGGDDYNIGRFEISIFTNGGNGGVRMYNRTRRVHGHHHPHVNEDGRPCLGNIKEVVPQLIAAHKYPALISVCIQYLKSYEDGNMYIPYCGISNWPKSKKRKGAGK